MVVVTAAPKKLTHRPIKGPMATNDPTSLKYNVIYPPPRKKFKLANNIIKTSCCHQFEKNPTEHLTKPRPLNPNKKI